jgi:hypothetical protein
MRGNLNEKYNLRELFGSTTTINKLFRPEYRIPEEYKDVPAYFLGMMNPGMRLVRFESPDHSFLLYGLALIDTIPYQFNFDRFIDNMVVYRDYSHEFKKKRK